MATVEEIKKAQIAKLQEIAKKNKESKTLGSKTQK